MQSLTPLTLWLVISITASCIATGSDMKKLTPGEPFRLGINQAIQEPTQGLVVRFTAVIGDSRCPRNVNCFWAGNGEIEIQVQRGNEKDIVRLHTHGGDQYPKKASTSGVTITLEDLEPYPETTAKIDPGSYIAALKVEV